MGSADIGCGGSAGEESLEDVWKQGWQSFVEISGKLSTDRGVDRLRLVVKTR